MLIVRHATCISRLGEHFKGEYYDCVDRYYDWGVLEHWAFDTACLLANTSGLAETFALDLDGNGVMAHIWRAAFSAYGGMQTIGFLLIVLYFVLELLDLTTRDNFNLEQLLRMTIKLFIAILLIANGWDLLRLLIELSNGLLHSLSAGNQGAAFSTVSIIYHEVAKLDVFELIVYPLTHLFDFAGGGLPWLIYLFMVHARMIEIVVRAIWAPVAMANIYQGGLNSSGIKYLKKFFAVCLHGALIFLCVVVKSNIVDIMSSSVEIPAAILIVELVGISVMIKSKSWANDIVGV